MLLVTFVEDLVSTKHFSFVWWSPFSDRGGQEGKVSFLHTPPPDFGRNRSEPCCTILNILFLLASPQCPKIFRSFYGFVLHFHFAMIWQEQRNQKEWTKGISKNWKQKEGNCLVEYVENTHYLTVVQKSLLKIGTEANVLWHCN